MEFESEVDLFLTSVDVGYRKPHVKGFEMLAEQLKVKTDNLTYVGNEKKDIDGSRSIGAQSILISRDRVE